MSDIFGDAEWEEKWNGSNSALLQAVKRQI